MLQLYLPQRAPDPPATPEPKQAVAMAARFKEPKQPLQNTYIFKKNKEGLSATNRPASEGTANNKKVPNQI